MWFDPSELLSKSVKPPDNMANFVEFENETCEISPEISRISAISSDSAGKNNNEVKLLGPSQEITVTCRACQYFQSFNKHGGGAGVCGVGVQSPSACWWADTVHQCTEING